MPSWVTVEETGGGSTGPRPLMLIALGIGSITAAKRVFHDTLWAEPVAAYYQANPEELGVASMTLIQPNP